MTKIKVLLFTKQTFWCEKVLDFCIKHFAVTWFKGERGDRFPVFDFPEYDYIISYLSPWIIPKNVLDLAKIAAINFHPGPPKYPGIGGYNFALYNGDKKYGVVAHIMEEKVDSGKIIGIEEFPILENETVMSLKKRSMLNLLHLFHLLMEKEILYGKKPTRAFAEWQHEPYTRKDLQELCKLNYINEPEYVDLGDENDIERWYNACYFPNAIDKPHFEANGKKYYIIREDHYDRHISGWKLPSRYYNKT